MALFWIDVLAADGHDETVRHLAEGFGATEVIVGACAEDGRRTIRILAGEIDRQAFLDQLQAILQATEGWRIVVSPVEAVIPRQDSGDGSPADGGTDAGGAGAGGAGDRENEAEARLRRAGVLGDRLTREELYEDIAAGTHAGRTFIALTILSTLVAAVGLESANTAIVIGAMVIAPLLGPNLAFAFGSAIGDRHLMARAMRANLIGLTLTVAISMAIPHLVTIDMSSPELLARTEVGYADVLLALASGAAAALSVTSSLSGALVGVMVAVALMPPAVAFGMMLSLGAIGPAMGALTLLGINVASLNLAANLAFLLQGLRPRTWNERREARQPLILNLAVWLVLLVVLVGLIGVRAAEPG